MPASTPTAITPGAAQFYYRSELVERQGQLTRWLATHKPGQANGVRWSDVLGWLNVVQAELATR